MNNLGGSGSGLEERFCKPSNYQGRFWGLNVRLLSNVRKELVGYSELKIFRGKFRVLRGW